MSSRNGVLRDSPSFKLMYSLGFGCMARDESTCLDGFVCHFLDGDADVAEGDLPVARIGSTLKIWCVGF